MMRADMKSALAALKYVTMLVLSAKGSTRRGGAIPSSAAI